MMKRNPASDFAPGALVFPGGMLEATDTEDWQGLLPSAAAEDTLLAWKIAAIRETFEESGILLARKKGAINLLQHQQLEALQCYREPVNRGELSFRQWICDQGLELATDQLLHCANWITPRQSPKRFDTHFFLARMPFQQGEHDGSELVESFWVSPQKVVEFAQTDEYRVVFVTEMNALWLSRFTSIEAISNAAKKLVVEPVEARVEIRGEQVWLTIPETAGYGVTERMWRM